MNIPLLNTLLRLADLALGCRQAAGNAEAAARALGEHNRAWQEIAAELGPQVPGPRTAAAFGPSAVTAGRSLLSNTSTARSGAGVGRLDG